MLEEDVDVSLEADNWLGVAFSFRNAEVERRYREETLHSKPRHDTIAFMQGVFPGNVLAYIYWTALPPLKLAHFLFNSFSCLVFLCLCVWKKEFYMKWRNPIVCYTLLHGMSLFVVLGKTEEAPNPTWLAILGRIILKSPVLVALYVAMNLGMHFRNHILLQLSTIPVLLIWAADFSVTCCPGGDPENEVLRTLGEIIQASLMFMSSFYLPWGLRCSCFTVVSSVVVLMGMLVPIGLVYMLEMISRKAFVSQHFPRRMSSELKRSMSHNFYSIWYVVLVVENLWMGCCVLSGV
ncbi:hypothetical protein BSKO_12433 [Bryopsis sp. KO-2023]|nr:hypothetical protein BSKO_12433 [Bryopsis sp. KO-2023]